MNQGEKTVVQKAGGYEKLELVSFEIPIPGPNEVLIEVEAAGVNFADCCVRAKKYLDGLRRGTHTHLDRQALESGESIGRIIINFN